MNNPLIHSMIFHDLWHFYSPVTWASNGSSPRSPRSRFKRCRTLHFLSFGKSNITGYISYYIYIYISYIIYIIYHIYHISDIISDIIYICICIYYVYIYNTYNIQMLIWNPCRSYQFLHLFLSQSINIPRAAYTGYVPSHKCSTICLEPHARKTKSQLAPLAASASQFGPTKAFLTRGDRADDRNVWDLMMISSIYIEIWMYIYICEGYKDLISCTFLLRPIDYLTPGPHFAGMDGRVNTRKYLKSW